MSVERRWIEVDPVYFDNKRPGFPRERGKLVEFVLLLWHCKKIRTRKSVYTQRKRGSMTISRPTHRGAIGELRRFIERKDVVLLKKARKR